MQKQKRLVDSTVTNFKKEVNQLINKRSDWQENQFKSSNEMLYDLLARVYELYLQSRGGEKADVNKRAWLVEQCEEREITFLDKKSLRALSPSSSSQLTDDLSHYAIYDKDERDVGFGGAPQLCKHVSVVPEQPSTNP